jgi:hypothetical protein
MAKIRKFSGRNRERVTRGWKIENDEVPTISPFCRNFFGRFLKKSGYILEATGAGDVGPG